MHARPVRSGHSGRCAVRPASSGRLRLPRSRTARVALAACAALALTAAVLFPGRRLGIALSVATGIGRAALQQRIDALEERAIRGDPFDDADRAFLSDLYRTLATGGKVAVVLRQTGRMMDHYLDGSGADYRLDPRIFTDNATVRAETDALRRRAKDAGAAPGASFVSAPIHMADPANPDSVAGLYFGTLRMTVASDRRGAPVLSFRAEVPWRWPSYAELEKRHGDPRAERFPIPGIGGLLFGSGDALLIGNGLGAELAEEGLATPFLAFAEWDERGP
ncbi:MAG: hypothetical protein HMLKMBBP_03740 [Planctomycetes bacterium]|nr:hypothetical protein [Planctomycetota bacterium]